MKRRYQQEEPDEGGIEQRLVNLLVRVGDKNLSNLPTHVKGLAGALKADLEEHRQLIIDTILDCVRALQPKTPVYGALVGVLNADFPDVGAEVASLTQSSLQVALDDHAPLSIRGLTRFAMELCNARVISASTALTLIETLFAVRFEDAVAPARADWFATLALDAIILAGGTLKREMSKQFEALLAAMRTYAEQRQPVPGLLLPFGELTAPGEVEEHFDALWTIVQAMASDGSWRSPCVLSLVGVFKDDLEAASSSPVLAISVPPHTTGCTYPSLRRLRLLSADATAGAGGGGGGGEAMEVQAQGQPPAERRVDRILLEEYCWMLTNAFTDSHRECAKLLLQMQENFAVDAALPFIEALLSMLLLLPSPRHKLVYYSCLLLNLSKLFHQVPALLEKAANKLMEVMPRLDPELGTRVAHWLSLHISHFGFNLAPFETPWKRLLGEEGEGGEGDRALSRQGSLTRSAFVSLLLERMMRLSYYERVTRELPAPLLERMPAKPRGVPFWTLRADEEERRTLMNTSEALLMRLRQRVAAEELSGWLEDAVDKRDLCPLVLHSLLNAGSKSPSHLEKLFVKFGWLLESVVAGEAEGRAALAAAAGSFFAEHEQLLWLSMEKLIKHRVIDAQAVVSWLCSSAGQPRLGLASTWDALGEMVDQVIVAQREAANALSIEEERYRVATEDLEEGDRNEAAEERLASRQSALEGLRREKKALFANLYVGVAAALSERLRSNAAEGKPPADAWWRATAGLATALGRRCQAELPLVSIEMVVEGSEEVDADVREKLFGGLRTLHAFAS